VNLESDNISQKDFKVQSSNHLNGLNQAVDDFEVTLSLSSRHSQSSQVSDTADNHSLSNIYSAGLIIVFNISLQN